MMQRPYTPCPHPESLSASTVAPASCPDCGGLFFPTLTTTKQETRMSDKINYQEVIDDAVAGCCDTFGATEGEDAVAYALAEARESSTGWVDFLGKLYRSVLDRLSVVPKAEIDTA